MTSVEDQRRLDWLSDAYDRHGPAAYSLALWIAGEASIADDVTERAFRALAAVRADPARDWSIDRAIRSIVCEFAVASARGGRSTPDRDRDRATAAVERTRGPAGGSDASPLPSAPPAGSPDVRATVEIGR